MATGETKDDDESAAIAQGRSTGSMTYGMESKAEEMSGLQRLKMLAFEMQRDEKLQQHGNEKDVTTPDNVASESESVPTAAYKQNEQKQKPIDDARKLVILPQEELGRRAEEAEESIDRAARILNAIVSWRWKHHYGITFTLYVCCTYYSLIKICACLHMIIGTPSRGPQGSCQD